MTVGMRFGRVDLIRADARIRLASRRVGSSHRGSSRSSDLRASATGSRRISLGETGLRISSLTFSVVSSKAGTQARGPALFDLAEGSGTTRSGEHRPHARLIVHSPAGVSASSYRLRIEPRWLGCRRRAPRRRLRPRTAARLLARAVAADIGDLVLDRARPAQRLPRLETWDRPTRIRAARSRRVHQVAKQLREAQVV